MMTKDERHWQDVSLVIGGIGLMLALLAVASLM